MRVVARGLVYGLALLALVIAAGWLFLPREPVDDVVDFDPAGLPDDLDAYLAASEAGVDELVPGAEKRIVWADGAGERTEDVVVYLHGFSASAEEIRPVPDRVAGALGANLLFWRLSGHGRDGAAMAEPSAGDWIEDTAEALAVADRLGDRVTVISTSTGGTLSAIAAVHPALAGQIDRLVFVSPNFAIANPAARLVAWPGARLWAPVLAGADRQFTPVNAAHERFWTTSYPTVATVPLGALLRYTDTLDFSQAGQPALFVFSDEDRVVSPNATRRVAAAWGGPVSLAPQTVGPGDDPYAHVIAGDILSPGMTDGVVATILDWMAGL